MSNPIPAPSIGRIVHYQSYGTPGGEYLPEPRAAIITAVHNEDPVPEHGVPYVDLCVLNPTGMFFSQQVKFSETPEPGHWNWPPRAATAVLATGALDSLFPGTPEALDGLTIR